MRSTSMMAAAASLGSSSLPSRSRQSSPVSTSLLQFMQFILSTVHADCSDGSLDSVAHKKPMPFSAQEGASVVGGEVHKLLALVAGTTPCSPTRTNASDSVTATTLWLLDAPSLL